MRTPIPLFKLSLPAMPPAIMALTAFSLFSFGDVILKLMAQHYNAFTIAFYVTGMVALMAFVLAAFRGELPAIWRTADRKWHIIRSLLLTTQFLLMVHALSILPLATVYALIFTAPLLTVPFAWLLLREVPSRIQMILTVVGFAGVLLILRPGLVPLDMVSLGMVAAAAAFALSHICARRMTDTNTPFLAYPLYVELTVMLCAAPFFLRAPVIPEPAHLGLMAVAAVWGLAALALLGTALRRGDTARIAPTHYVQMVWAVGLGWVFFAHLPDLYMIAGSALIIGSGVVLLRQPQAASNP